VVTFPYRGGTDFRASAVLSYGLGAVNDGDSQPEGGGPTDDRLVGGRYRLGAHLGSGGMGTVWLADDELLQRQVAVKEVRVPTGMSAPEIDRMRQRYLREARAAARLHHPGVVAVYDVLSEPERVWIVMEYISARNLAEVISEDGVLPPTRVARIGLQVLDALDSAHQAGVLHRDVKPANVLVDVERGDRAVLTDFGVASVSGDVSLTRTGQLVGSPAYFSPERLTGGDVGPASDIWSLGCTLYAAVEGKPPFLRDEQFAVITAITLDPVPNAPRAGLLAPVLAGLLDKDTHSRWNATRAKAALARVAEGLPAEMGDDVESSWGGAPPGTEPAARSITGRAPVSGPPVEPWPPGTPHPADPASGAFGSSSVSPWPPGTVYGTPTGGQSGGVEQPRSGPSAASSPGWTSAPPASSPGWSSGPPAGASSPGWAGGSPGYSSGPPAVSSSPGWTSGPPAAYGTSGGMQAPMPVQPPERPGSRWWLWPIAVIVIVALIAALTLLARSQGLLGGGAKPTPTVSTPAPGPGSSGPPDSPEPGATSSGLSTRSFEAPDKSYQLSYPAAWNKDCVVQKDGRSFCYFDEIPAGHHEPTDSMLDTNPYVLVLTGDANGKTALRGLTEEDTAAQGAHSAFPDYKQVTLSERVYGPNTGALLEFTATGVKSKLPRRIRIFRIVSGDKFYEVSLRSTEQNFASYVRGFETIATSLTPR
jgi:serine/threonine protein kinase